MIEHSNCHMFPTLQYTHNTVMYHWVAFRRFHRMYVYMYTGRSLVIASFYRCLHTWPNPNMGRSSPFYLQLRVLSEYRVQYYQSTEYRLEGEEMELSHWFKSDNTMTFYNDFLQECIGTGIWVRARNSIKFETSWKLPPSTKNSNTYWACCLDLSHCC